MQEPPARETAPPPVDMLRRIYAQPWDLTPLLRAWLAHADETYGDALPPRCRDMLARFVERNHPAWNVVAATLLLDTLDALRARIVALNDTPFTRDFLVFVHEKCIQLRTCSFSDRDMHETLCDFAHVVSTTYLQHNTLLVAHVVRQSRGDASFDALGYAPPLSASAIVAARRAPPK
jgi:hypothetical protein